MGRSNAIARTHSSVPARPDEKMNQHPYQRWWTWIGGRLQRGEWTPLSTGQREVLKRSANKKRRQRDREVSQDD